MALILITVPLILSLAWLSKPQLGQVLLSALSAVKDSLLLS